ncbi:transporter [Trinickia sp. LjRoot230]|uniref:SphA family protein n=1 Tax=Trinickia sp. LjRoot230 TaxID=3342288 RepID=UPI003ECE5E3A
MKWFTWRAAFAVSLLACVTGNAFATEGGGDTIGAGAEGFLAGALPPPGFYGVLYYNYYHASRFNDSHGSSAVPGFDLNANVVIPRLLYMSNVKVFGGRLGGYGFVAFPALNVYAAGTHDSRAGLSDTVAGPLLHWGERQRLSYRRGTRHIASDRKLRQRPSAESRQALCVVPSHHRVYMNASRLRRFFVCCDYDRMGCSFISGLVAARCAAAHHEIR